jgi:predicted Zn-dependent protease
MISNRYVMQLNMWVVTEFLVKALVAVRVGFEDIRLLKTTVHETEHTSTLGAYKNKCTLSFAEKML